MPREEAKVLSLAERPRLVRNELIRINKPLENMGLYRWSLRLYRMADIIIGPHDRPDEVISLVCAKPVIQEKYDQPAKLLTVDSGALASLRAGKPLVDIEADRDGHIEVSDPTKPSTRIGPEGDFGSEWAARNKYAGLLVMVSIRDTGAVEIEDKVPNGVFVRADWAATERLTNAVSIGSSEVPGGAAAAIISLPEQRKRLS